MLISDNGHKQKTKFIKKNLIFLIFFAIVFVCFSIANVSANTNTLNLSSLGDSYIDQHNPSTNYGSNWHMYVNPKNNQEEKLLIIFNLNSLPSNIIVNSANLYIFLGSDVPSSSRTHNIYKITSSWTESEVKWSNQPSISSSLTSSTNTGTTPFVWKNWDVTSDVQDFLSGAATNYGWEIKDNNETPSNNYNTLYRTREHPSNEQGGVTNPYLQINYVCESGWLGGNCSIPDCSSLNNCSGNGECVAPNN